MKKYSWLLLFLYFALFIIFGFVFYFKYLDRFLKSGAEPQTVETAQSPQFIYYSSENNLYRINSDLAFEISNPDRVQRFQSTGQVANLDINKNGEIMVYEAQTENNGEIWQVKTSTNESSKIAFIGERGLEDFNNFHLPKFSQDGRKLAFIASADTDHIMVKNLADGSLGNITSKFAVKITDFAWSRDSKSIFFCTGNLPRNTCYKINLETETDEKVFEADVGQIEAGQNCLIYLARDESSVNLFKLDLETLAISNLSDLKSPKKVSRFSLDQAGQKVAYEVTDAEKTDIYYVKTDGANKIQITTDSKSFRPVFNFLADKIAYQRNFDGIYTIKIDKTTEQKIANLIDTHFKLLLWR